MDKVIIFHCIVSVYVYTYKRYAKGKGKCSSWNHVLSLKIYKGIMTKIQRNNGKMTATKDSFPY